MIIIVGHITVPAILWIETDYSPPVWLQLSIYLPFMLLASLALLQPVKGAVVGMQWALRMHGFDENAPSRHSAGVEQAQIKKRKTMSGME